MSLGLRLKRQFQRNVGGGVDRDALANSDFALPGERKFPVVIPKDVADAVSAWGHYRGPTGFDTFKRNLMALAKRKGLAFVARLPESWGVETKAVQDAPNLREMALGSPRCCGTCAHWNIVGGHGFCDFYQFQAQSEWMCDSWTVAVSPNLSEPSLKESQVPAGLTIFKQADGRYRWVMLSSNAFRDRDGEIVSTKALEADCTRAERTGVYGPLRWWHVGEPDGDGIDLGDTDFSAMSGRVRVDSGTFYIDAVGAAVAAKADRYQGSIGFRHPPTEPDAEKVFHHIRVFERSLVPAGRAANPFTRLLVQQQEDTTVKAEKEAELKALLNNDEGLLGRVMGWVRGTEKQADAMGVAFKSDEGCDSDDFNTLQAAADAAAAALKADGEGDDGETDEEEAVDGEEEVEVAYVGDMTTDDLAAIAAEFVDAIEQAVGRAIAPLVAALDTTTKMGGMMDDMNAMYARHGSMLEEMKTLMGGYVSQKDGEAAEQAAEIGQLKTALAATETAVKAVDAAKQQQIALLEATLKEMQTEAVRQQEQTAQRQAVLATELAALKGEAPRGVKPYIASEADDTVLADSKRLKSNQPQADPVAEFGNWLFQAQQAQQQHPG